MLALGKTEAEALAGTWPLIEQADRFELGFILNSVITDALPPLHEGVLGAHHAGLWECDLADQSLIWSGVVFDLFGLERSTPVTRELALTHYTEESRAKMERLRTQAILHKVGFTLDVGIRAAGVGRAGRVRLISAPVLVDGAVAKLHGLKLAL